MVGVAMAYTQSWKGSSTQRGDFNSSMPGCVCPKVKDMGPFLASSE